MGAQMGGGDENTENSKAGTSKDLSPPTNNDFLMISLQLNQQQDLQNQQLQQQQSLDDQAKKKPPMRHIPSFDDRQNLLKLQNTFNIVKKELGLLPVANQLNAVCTPIMGPRENVPHAYKFTGKDRAKLAKKFLQKLKDGLKEEKRLEKEAKRNAMKVSISGEGIEGMKNAVEISHAMAGDPGSMMIVGAEAGVKIADKLMGGGDGGSKPEGSSKLFGIGIPSTRDTPTPFGGN